MAMLFSLLTIGLFGCGKTTTAVAHTTEDITAVAISRSGCMDQSCNYFFWLRAEEDTWLLNATCFIRRNEIEGVETELIGCPITAEEVNECMSLLEENDSITYVEKHKSTKQNHAVDADVESIVLTFSDGTQCVSSKTQAVLGEFFYNLTEKYADDSAS